MESKEWSHEADKKTRSVDFLTDSNSDSNEGFPFEEKTLTKTLVPPVDSSLSFEMVSSATAKATVLDLYMNLLTHDCKFSEFVLKILNGIMHSVKCEAGSILEIDHQNGSVFFRAVVGSSSERLVDFSIPIGAGIVGHVIESRIPLLVPNVPENSEHLSSVAETIGFEVKNMIALPIVIRGQVYGVIELLNRIGDTGFSTDDAELLTYLSKMAAKVIEIRFMLAWSKSASGAP